MSFDLVATCGGARAGVLHTAHGTVETPVFVPVGTRATVRGLAPDQLEAAGAQLLLANAYQQKRKIRLKSHLGMCLVSTTMSLYSVTPSSDGLLCW